MNKIVIILLFFASSLNAQNDYATLKIYRPSKLVGAAVGANININGLNICSIKNGGALEYKIFNTGNIAIQIRMSNNSSMPVMNYNLRVDKGQKYHFELKPKWQKFEMNSIKKAISKKIKDENRISLSDLNFDQNQIVYNHPKTDWTKERLINYWKNNEISPVEGIYEKIGRGIDYELAVLEEDNKFVVIYLSGANGTHWKEGDLKAKLHKTAQFGIFKSDWYMLNKNENREVLTTFRNSSMEIASENGSGTDVYLKIYPTYDEQQSSNSEWQSSGTGFFIDKSGYIVTNYHVINGGEIFEIEVTRNGETKSYNSKIISVDKQNDLAILKINNPNFKKLETLNYNFNTDTQDVGSSVFALGFPLTQIMGNEIKFTDGKISSKSGFQGDITTYQITVPIQAGNSGGPLFDEKGNLVGITSSGINKQIADNANYAIKTSYLKLLIDSTNDEIMLPKNESLLNMELTDQIKTLSEYVVLIKVK